MEEAKLGWMYKGVSGLVDREEYLTGRKIDKTFEIIEKEEAKAKGDFTVEDENDFSKTLLQKEGYDQNNRVTVDLSNKLREDPLYEIKKKQVEERKKLIDNPIKMKRIKQLLEKALNENDSDESSSDESKTSSGSSSCSSSSSTSSSSSHSSDRGKNRSKSKRPRKDNKRKYNEIEKDVTRYSDRSSLDKSRKYNRDHRKPERSYHIEKKKTYRHDRRESSISSSRRERSREVDNNNRDRHYHNKHHSSNTQNKHSKSYNSSNRSESSSSSSSKMKSSRLTEEEMERRRKEMLQNGNWREEQRKNLVQNCKEKNEQEDAKNNELKGAQFIKPMINNAMEVESLEKRVKQKIFTSQRSEKTMEQNFTRR